jgi:hypothetical protein
VIDELHYLEEHLASNKSLLARAAFRRVFKTVTSYWNHDGGRYRELDRAEVEPKHPFALTENTPSQRQRRRVAAKIRLKGSASAPRDRILGGCESSLSPIAPPIAASSSSPIAASSSSPIAADRSVFTVADRSADRSVFTVADRSADRSVA